MTTGTRSASASEIKAIVGPLDDAVIACVLAIGATPEDVLEAFTWADADDQIGTELGHGRRGALAESIKS